MPDTVVVMAALPPILATILSDALGSEPGVRIRQSLPTAERLEAAVVEEAPDVVIVGLNGTGDLTGFENILYAHPRMRMLGITKNGRRITAYELAPRLTTLGNLSPVEIAHVVSHGHGEVVEP